jgi:DNA-binding PadR family transcriptional regulator
MHRASCFAPYGRPSRFPHFVAFAGGFGPPESAPGEAEAAGRGRCGPGSYYRGPRRARRGDIRAAILLLLAEEPRNGYGLMQEIEHRSGGVWRPSPGSVYPALAQLEDEGLVRATEHEGRKSFELTDEGRAYVEANRDRMGTPWEAAGGGARSELHELRQAAQALAAAALQVAQIGSREQLAEARSVLEDARRRLYRLLAGESPEGGAEPEGGPPEG